MTAILHWNLSPTAKDLDAGIAIRERWFEYQFQFSAPEHRWISGVYWLPQNLELKTHVHNFFSDRKPIIATLSWICIIIPMNRSCWIPHTLKKAHLVGHVWIDAHFADTYIPYHRVGTWRAAVVYCYWKGLLAMVHVHSMHKRLLLLG